MTAQEKICTINSVEGFCPAELAMEYTDLNTNETRKRLPVMAQIAWFRLKYPEGRIAVTVQAAKDCFVATARVYRSCEDPPEHSLAEATASRGYSQDKPTVSPREWAQTAAIGIALRNAGFGLQFHAAGEPYEQQSFTGEPAEDAPEAAAPSEPEGLTYEKALEFPCPIPKHKGKTLGDLIVSDPKALVWIANKFSGEMQEAAKLICEHAAQNAA